MFLSTSPVVKVFRILTWLQTDLPQRSPLQDSFKGKTVIRFQLGGFESFPGPSQSLRTNLTSCQIKSSLNQVSSPSGHDPSPNQVPSQFTERSGLSQVCSTSRKCFLRTSHKSCLTKATSSQFLKSFSPDPLK